MKYRILLQPSDEGFAAEVLGLPGCHSQGATEEEALANIREAIRDYLCAVSAEHTRLVREQLAATVREVDVELAADY